MNETEGLRVLRQYLATCLLQGETLQKPPVPEALPNKNGELAFPIVGIDRAVMDALTELWVVHKEDGTRFAHAEWILQNLYIDHLGLQTLLSASDSEQNDLLIVSLTLSGFLSYALGLGVYQIDKKRTTRREYLEWVFDRIIRRRLHRNPYLLNGIVEEFKRSFFNVQEEALKEKSEEITLLILQQLYEDLPEPLKHEFANDADFMAKIGIKYGAVIEVEDLMFNKEDFFRAAHKAVNGQEAKISPHESKKYVTFQPYHKAGTYNAFCFDHPYTKEKKSVKRDELELLRDSPSEREAVLRQHREWFDCPADVFEQNVAKIASMEDPGQRIDEVGRWEETSATVYYATLYRKLRQQGGFQSADLIPPNLEGLLRHLRLLDGAGEHEPFQEVLKNSVRELIDEEGLLATIERLGGLPVSFPTVIIETFTALDQQDKREFVRRLLSFSLSPIAKFHLIYTRVFEKKFHPKYALPTLLAFILLMQTTSIARHLSSREQ